MNVIDDYDYPIDEGDLIFLIKYMKERFCINDYDAMKEIYKIP
jgi:hypothetical protein